MKKTTILLVLAVLCLSISTRAQDHILKGTITYKTGSPLPGATIKENGSTNSAQTGQNGTFELKTTQSKGKLTVSYLGYRTIETGFDTTKPLTLQLEEDENTLAAVEINTGYYSVKQKQLTGSISSVKAEQIERQPISNPLLALQGNVTGAFVTQASGVPGANVNILVRGQNSIDAGTAPLYLIDGVPYGEGPLTNLLSASAFGSTGASPFATLAPEDIQRIDILKDADATAIYGSRGANGVVLITTKKGKPGRLSIDLSSSFGASRASRFLPMMQTPDYLALRRTGFALDNTTVKAADYDLNTWDQDRNANWQKELLSGEANFSNSRLSVSGGSASSSFYLSATHQRQGSINLSDNRYAKTALQFSATQQGLDGKLKVNVSVGYSADNSHWTNSEPTARAITLSPNAPEPYLPDGSLNWASSTWINPMRNFENPYRAKNGNLVANLSVSYELIKGLTASLSAGYTARDLKDESYTGVSYYDPAEAKTPSSSILDQNSSSASSLIAEPQLSYRLATRFGTIDLLTGLSVQKQRREQLILRGSGFASDAMIENIRSATTVTVRENSLVDYRYSGLYGRIGYSLKDRYILNLTARRDGSSRFGTDKRMANFGAIGAAYIASETRLIKEEFPFISLLKVRASYGTSGNDQIGDYEYLDTYQFALGYNATSGLMPVRLYNPDFSWESNRKAEVGLEFGLFSDKLRGSLSYYRNRSSSQLIDYPLPATAGFTSIRANLDATVQNSGTEVELGYSAKLGRIGWTANLNYTIPRNRLVSFPGLANSSYASRYAVGQPLSVGKAYHLLGVDPTSGLYTYEDYNNDKVITTADRQQLVQRGQRGYGGLSNSFTYGNFEFSFLLQYVDQRSVTFRALLSGAPGRMVNQPLEDLGKYWTKPGDIAELQRPTSGANAEANTAFANYLLSDAATGDASFLRLKNLSVSYRTTKLIPGKTVRLFAQGQNLYTATNYFGLDPETASLVTPPLQTFTIGLQLGL